MIAPRVIHHRSDVAARPGAARKVFEPAAHLMNPPHRFVIGREDEDGAVVDDDLDRALVVLDANPDEPVSLWQV